MASALSDYQTKRSSYVTALSAANAAWLVRDNLRLELLDALSTATVDTLSSLSSLKAEYLSAVSDVTSAVTTLVTNYQDQQEAFTTLLTS